MGIHRPFTESQLAECIKDHWPSIGTELRHEIAGMLMTSPWLPREFTLADAVFANDELPSEHRLAVLLRYLAPLPPPHGETE